MVTLLIVQPFFFSSTFVSAFLAVVFVVLVAFSAVSVFAVVLAVVFLGAVFSTFSSAVVSDLADLSFAPFNSSALIAFFASFLVCFTYSLSREPPHFLQERTFLPSTSL